MSSSAFQILISPDSTSLLDHRVEDLGGRAGRGGDAACVQGHVAALDAVGDEGAQRGEVLRQADRGHDLGELAR